MEQFTMARIVVAAVTIIALLCVAPAWAAPTTGSIVTEISQMTKDIEESQNEIASLDTKLELTTKNMIRTYQRLDAQENSLEAQKQALNSRLGEVYKNYNDMLIGIFLDARSLTDIWKRFSFLAKINASDNQLLSANRMQVEQVRLLKEELNQKKQEQIDLKRRKQLEYLLLERALLQKRALLEEKLHQARLAAAANQAPATAVPLTTTTTP